MKPSEVDSYLETLDAGLAGAGEGEPAAPTAAEVELSVEDIAPVALGGEDRLPDQLGPESRIAEPMPAGQPSEAAAAG